MSAPDPLRLSFRKAPGGVDFAGRVAEIVGGARPPVLVATGDGPQRIEVVEPVISIPEIDPAPGGRLVFFVERDDDGRDRVVRLRLEEPSGDVLILKGMDAPMGRVLAWLKAARTDIDEADLPDGWFRGRDLQVFGGDANEELAGRDGDDLVKGGAGFDTFRLSGGHDAIFGGADIDRLVVKGAGLGQAEGIYVNLRQGFLRIGSDDTEVHEVERIEGGRGDDAMQGGAADETFLGGGGRDRLSGGTGDDLLFGGARADLLYGGDGDDVLVAGPGRDSLYGREGSDWLFNSGGAARLHGGAGRDVVWAGEADEHAIGGQGRDTLVMSSGDDVAEGGRGADAIFGGAGDDLLKGGAHGDRIWGESGADEIKGGGGADSVAGGDGADVVSGGDGADLVTGGAGADSLFGGGGEDSVYGGAGADALFGGAGADVLEGGAGEDRLQGGAGDDVLTGDGATPDAPMPVFGAPLLPSEDWEYVTEGGTGWSGAVIELVPMPPYMVVPAPSADVFVLDGAGVDTVTDFDLGLDRIELAPGMGFADLRMEASGDDLRIVVDATGAALGILTGLADAVLDADDFL